MLWVTVKLVVEQRAREVACEEEEDLVAMRPPSKTKTHPGAVWLFGALREVTQSQNQERAAQTDNTTEREEQISNLSQEYCHSVIPVFVPVFVAVS